MNEHTPIDTNARPLSTNPLKSSAPLGAAMAFLGVEGAIPLFHGSQGCTAFALVLMVRHFKESIPLQTTAMNEVSTILGGADHVEEALLNLKNRVKPKLIGLCTTALVETRGEDFEGDLRIIKARRAEELAGTEIVFASTPDFSGAMEEGWSKAVTAMVAALVLPQAKRVTRLKQVNILAGQHLTSADIDHIREMVEAFGLEPIILPDISGALDGTVPDSWVPTTYGGTSVDDIRRMGRSMMTLAIGEHMRAPAEKLAEIADVPLRVFDRLTGLDAVDRFVVTLSELSGKPVPARLRRRRSQLVDAMLDGHFHFGGLDVAIAAEPDLLFSLASIFTEMGARVPVAITTAQGNPILARVPAPQVRIGDLGDLEAMALDCDLLVTHSHGRQAAASLNLPLMRVGFPIFDRLGSTHKLTAGYEGTRNLIFEVANIVLDQLHEPSPEALDPFRSTQSLAAE
jgi:nitrogenase molybdenum-iron protein NifN